jgi:hypothetical protein
MNQQVSSNENSDYVRAIPCIVTVQRVNGVDTFLFHDSSGKYITEMQDVRGVIRDKGIDKGKTYLINGCFHIEVLGVTSK